MVIPDFSRILTRRAARATCEAGGWTFETTFPFVTGIAVESEKTVSAVIRNSGPTVGPIAISFVTMRISAP